MRIGLLGPLQVRDQAERPIAIGGRQVRVLLILLALEAGRVVPAGTLAGGLWPDELPGDPSNALQTLVSRLRAALRGAGCAGLIESHAAGYRLALPADAVDVLTFRTKAAQGRRALADGDAANAARTLREALGLWRGQPFADAEGYEFADAAAIRLVELRGEAVLDRIEAELALGEGASLIGELKATTAAEPLAERPRTLLMRALYAGGRQAEALAAYTEFRELLAERLGVDPSPALQKVHLRILRGEESHERPVVPPAGTLAPPAVAAPLTSFVGREDEMSRLLKLLRDSARLVTLTGPGGVGKTRLATEVSGRREMAAALNWPGPPAAAYFVPLAPVTDPAEVPYALLDALGMLGPVIQRRTGETAPAIDRLCAALSDRDDMLILDNCEHVIEAVAALAAQVLATCPRIRIVATSREPLRIEGETLWTVPPLPVPPPADPSSETYAAVRLLCDRAASVLPAFRLDAGNAEAVGRVCRMLDGIPLAIELAAVWLRVLSPAQLAERLGDRFALLTGGSRAALPRHQTLRAVVDWSWELLSEPERVLARRLSVFPDGATLAAAEQVCSGDGLPAAEVLVRLSGLVDKSILAMTSRPDDVAPRYRMLETVRAYCLEKLSAAGEARRVRDRFSAYYLDLAETADPLLRGAEQTRWLRELTAEQDNIHAALRWLVASHDTDGALRLVMALGWYWLLRGQPGEPVTLAANVLALGPGSRTMRMAEARVICALVAAGPTYDLDQVRTDLDAAVAALGEWAADWPSYHPMAAMVEPVLAMFDHDFDRAQSLIARFHDAADPWLRAAASLLRASFGGMLGSTREFEDDLRRSLAAFRELGEKWGSAGALLQLAQLSQVRGDCAGALAELEEATALGRALGAWGDLPQIDGKLASVRVRMGDLAGARVDLDRAEHAGAGACADRADAAAWLSVVRAELCWREGDRDEAERLCRSALAWMDTQKPAWFQAMRAQVLARLAVFARERGNGAQALTLLGDALRAATVWVDHSCLADVIDAVALLAADSDARMAATLLGVAHTIRGAFDESSLDAPGVRQAAREALGLPGFETAYQRGRDLSYADGLAFAAQVTGADLSSGHALRR